MMAAKPVSQDEQRQLPTLHVGYHGVYQSSGGELYWCMLARNAGRAIPLSSVPSPESRFHSVNWQWRNQVCAYNVVVGSLS